jgi:hypothetical protein
MKLTWSGGRFLPLVLCVLLIQNFVTANDETIEYENDFDGTNIAAAASRELRVNVINGYDFPVEVYYDDSQGGILLVCCRLSSLFTSRRWNWKPE